MRPFPSRSVCRVRFLRAGVQAFTLAELMVMVAIFLMLVVAMLSSQLFGMRLYRASETRLMAAADAREALNHVRAEIRSAQLICVGNGDDATFKLVADNQPHQGNALRIYPVAANTNHYVYYYMDAANSCLKRIVSDTREEQVVANNEDFQGNVVTNYVNNQVLRVNLEFCRREYATADGTQFGCYQLQTRISPRTN
jgi:type II secretory pathway pseudopilin PulG